MQKELNLISSLLFTKNEAQEDIKQRDHHKVQWSE